MWLTRRILLITAAATGALAAAGFELVQLPPVAPGSWALSEGELESVTALGEAMFPPGNPLGVSGPDVGIAHRVDHLIGQDLDPEIRDLFRYLLKALDEGTLLSRGQRFGALSLEDRRSVLAHWEDNDLLPRRALYDGLRLVMGMAFFNTSEVNAAIGWKASCHLGSA